MSEHNDNATPEDQQYAQFLASFPPEKTELQLARTLRAAGEVEAMPSEMAVADRSICLQWAAERCLAIFDEGESDSVGTACFVFGHLLGQMPATQDFVARTLLRETLLDAAGRGREAFWQAMINSASAT